MNFESLIEKIAIPLTATFAGAFLAFRYQFSIEKNRDKRAVVQNLMMYRNVNADELDWIKSINAIDIVFHNNERVRQLLDRFLDCTGTPEKFERGEHVPIYYEMLYLMAQDCGYTQITEAGIKRNIYSPKALDLHYPNRYYSPGERPTTPELATLLDEISQLGSA